VVRKKPKQTVPDPNFAPFAGFTANQVVAFNLTQARDWRGWTQEEAAAALEPYLGVRWSKATFSQAERSVAGRFIRNFTADEIVAFARGFELPVTWFFMPPPPWAAPGIPSRLAVPDEPQFGEPVGTLVDLVFGNDSQQALLTLRLDSFLDALGPAGLTAAQGRVASLVHHRVEAIVRNAFRQLEDWQTTLRAMANQLGQLELRSKAAISTELGIKHSELGMGLGRHELDDDAGPSSDPTDERSSTDGIDPPGPA
jgi:hypothetical protein